MNTITLFFDSHCPLCAAEMQRLARWDRHDRLVFIDMQGKGFDAARYGTTWAAMDAQLHALRANGDLLVGIAAIEAAYTAAGRPWLVAPLRWRPTRRLWSYLYRAVARNRYRISKYLGYGCPNGVCRNPHL